MALQQRNRSAGEDLDAARDAEPTPGKETQVQRLAAAGVSGPGGAMPFADQIASSFGPAHADTVRGISAHTGGAATAASEDIGARAYATGNQVALAGTPDLHTAAHEAAHVVQQRRGVHLKTAFTEAGDPCERHADAVADRVVSGLSAASLLGEPGSAGASSAVQRKEAPKKPSKADQEKEFEADGRMVVYALSGVFKDSQYMMESMPSKYVDAMHKLRRVIHGDGKWGHVKELEGRERRALFDEVYPVFDRFALSNAHFGGDDDALPTKWTNLRHGVMATEAYDRVENAVVIGEGKDKKAMDMPDDAHPREQAVVLKAALPTLIAAIQKMIKTAQTQGATVDKNTLKQLLDAEQTLTDGEGFLALSDEEFKLKLDKIKTKFNGVATYSGFVKMFLQVTSGAISYTCKAGGLLMKAVGDKAMAHICEETAESVSKGFGQVIAAVQIIHGISVFLDKNASSDDKIGAGVEIAGGVAVLATGETLAALPITGPYLLVKGAQYLYSEAVIGWETDLVRGAFQDMQHDAHLIGRAMETLAAAQLLQIDEQDAERRTALAAEEKTRTQHLHGAIASFLRDTEFRDHGPGSIYTPGNLQIISDAFAGPREHLAGAGGQKEIIALTHEVSKQIAWCFSHGPAIIKATATNKSIVDVEEMEEKLEAGAKKK